MIGNGSFGTWITDKYGLPAYKYTYDDNIIIRITESYKRIKILFK